MKPLVAPVPRPRSPPHSAAGGGDKQATENKEERPELKGVTPSRIGALGAALIALTLGGLALHLPGDDSVGSTLRTNVFMLLLALAGTAYLLAVRQVLRRPAGRPALLLVIGVAIALRAPLLPTQPFLSSDMYRYIWDGRVTDAGINPYGYIPADPALAPLRDTAIYPHINRRTYAHTIYPPAAELIFAAVAAISPTVIAMKLAMLAFETMGMICIALLLRQAALPAEHLLIYAWNPLAVWCFAGNGHVDAIVVGFTGLALLSAAAGRAASSGLALAAATLTKFLPITIAPALWRAWDWKLPLTFAAVCPLLYLPFTGVGAHVLGFLPQYSTEEGIAGGRGIWLLAGISGLGVHAPWTLPAYIAIVGTALATLALALTFRPQPLDASARTRRLCGNTAILAACAVAAISPHYPWYFVWLAVPACIQPWRAVIWLSVAPLVLYLDPLREYFIWPSLVYIPALLLAFQEMHVHARAITGLAPVRSR